MPEEVHKAVRIIGLNLASDVLLALHQRPQSFTEIKEGIRGSQRGTLHDSTFNRALRRVKRHRLVCLGGDEYRLTDSGRELASVLVGLRDWAIRYPDSLEFTPGKAPGGKISGSDGQGREPAEQQGRSQR